MARLRPKGKEESGSHRRGLNIGEWAWLNRLSLRLLYWGRKYRKTAFAVTSFIGVGVIRGVVYIVEEPLGGTVVEDYGGHLLSVLLALSIFPAIALYVERRNIAHVLSISRRTNGPNQAPSQSFLTENLQQMSRQLDELEGEGAVLPRYEVARWVKWCFETACTKHYMGTDSHVPSQYRNIYSEYLAAHERFIQRVPDSGSKRVMIIIPERLRADRTENPKDNGIFFKWHQTDHRLPKDANGTPKRIVKLHQLSPHANAELLKNANPSLEALADTDIAFWDGDFVLLFNPIKESIDPADGAPTEVRVRLREKGTELYLECQRYVGLLEEAADRLSSELPIYSDKLSENWKRFAAPELRVKQTVPLIEDVVAEMPEDSSRIRILDAAAGVGFEAITLLSKGHWVQLNEIEGSLREAAKQYAKEKEVLLPDGQFSRSNWLELDQQFQTKTFDVVLVLGNSLCHLEGPHQLEAAILQFHSMLRDGGVLICDERNFDSIMEHLEEILPDPINNFTFNNKKDRVMYLGTGVLGAPVSYDGSRLTFEYWDVELKGGSYRKVSDAPLGALSMYPFKRGVLRATLERCGFHVDVLCDLKQNDDNGLAPECDFYTYIAKK